MTMRTLFQNATVVTVNETNQILSPAYVAVEGQRITYVGTEKPQGEFHRVVDCTGKVLMPGLVNTHTHIPMTLMRGFAGGHDLQTWLNDYIFPTEDKLDGKTVQIGSKLALAEMIASGTTSFAEMYYFCGDIAQAVEEAGLSANIARSVTIFSPTDDPAGYYACQDLDAFRRRWAGTGDDQIKAEVSIHAEYTSFLSPNLWDYLAGYAKEYGLGMQVHISETQSEHRDSMERHGGKTPLQILDDHGVWGTRSIAAHCVWVSEEDMALMASRGISAALNPYSNLKLGSGIAPVPQLAKAGVNLTLGTDGASSNNSLDLFEELKLTATLHSGTTQDPMAVTPTQALRMATVNGGKALGRKTGVIAPGYVADLILLDFRHPNLMPCHDVVENIVYAASGKDVCLTMARGKILYEDGVFTTLDLDQIRTDVAEYAMPKLFGHPTHSC
jgi:5-methylthioadenosine/S-adenosylhomocysteine deaminase